MPHDCLGHRSVTSRTPDARPPTYVAVVSVLDGKTRTPSRRTRPVLPMKNAEQPHSGDAAEPPRPAKAHDVIAVVERVFDSRALPASACESSCRHLDAQRIQIRRFRPDAGAWMDRTGPCLRRVRAVVAASERQSSRGRKSRLSGLDRDRSVSAESRHQEPGGA